jgi:hypothetical protein
MWKSFVSFFDRLIQKVLVFSSRDNKETWTLLEMRRKANLENLEDLKKLRLKNF